MQTQPPVSGALSPDGMYRWDGTRWSPVPSQAATPLATMGSGRTSSLAWLFIAGGLVAAVGAIAVLVGCFVPYASYSDGNGGSTESSIFNAGFPGALWYAIEPIAVIVFTLAAAIAAVAWDNRIVRALLGGALTASGIQTLALFLGYAGAAPSEGHLEAGAIIGAAGSLAVFVGGLAVAAGALSTKQASPGAGAKP